MIRAGPPSIIRDVEMQVSIDCRCQSYTACACSWNWNLSNCNGSTPHDEALICDLAYMMVSSAR